MFIWTHATLGSARRINAIHSGTDTIWTLWHEAMKMKSAKRTGQFQPAPGSSVILSKFVRDEWENHDLPGSWRSQHLQEAATGWYTSSTSWVWAPRTEGKGKNRLLWTRGETERGERGYPVPERLQKLQRHSNSVVREHVVPLPRITHFFPLKFAWLQGNPRGLCLGFTPGERRAALGPSDCCLKWAASRNALLPEMRCFQKCQERVKGSSKPLGAAGSLCRH